ncbi:YpzG family protein [Jeotgalibacillus proteolyticus]|uniref:YpzG family protein n=1 Tax=Jeotgalibacillus proteolyticus TaxID=2082395 RepID=UPI003CE8FCAF
MSTQDHLDPQSQKFHHNWTRPKHASSQVNGQTEMSQHDIKLRRVPRSGRR